MPSPGMPAAPEVTAAMRAEFAAVDAAGGIDGHPVRVISCDDEDIASQAEACAEQAVHDSSVLGALFQFDEQQNVDIPLMDKAGIPEVGIDPGSPVAESCSTCFPIVAGGDVDCVAVPVLQHIYQNVNNVDLVEPNLPVAPESLKLAKDAFLNLVPNGQVAEAYPPIAATDLSSYIESDKNAQGTSLCTGGSQLLDWVQTANSLGLNKMQWGIIPITFTPSLLKQAGSLLNGAVGGLDTQSPTSNVSGAQQYRATLAKYAPGTAIDELSLYGWMSAKMFADAANSVKGPLTRGSIVAALDSLRSYSFGGLTPPYSAGTPFTGMEGVAPRLYNTTVFPVKIESGQIVPIGTSFVDPFTGKTVP
jgi:branched-chain amino acid transport system substrate-binding protein